MTVATNDSKRTADIRAASQLLTQRPVESPSGPEGSSEGASAEQRTGFWTDKEKEELCRLAGVHTGPQGTISWVAVLKAWKDLNLRERTKASLTAKWRAIQKAIEDAASSQGSTAAMTSHSVTTDIIIPTQDQVDNNSTVPKERKRQPSETAVADVDNTTMIDITSMFYRNLERSKKIGCKPNRRKAPRRVSGRAIQPIINEVNGLIDKELDMESQGRPSWEKLSIVVYAGAMTVSEIGNRRDREKQERSREWFHNTSEEVKSLCSIIGKATAELNRQKVPDSKKITFQQTKNIRMLERRYKADTFAKITSLVEKLSIRLRLLRTRIALRVADERRYRVRHTPLKMLHRSIGEQSSNKTPDVHQVRNYWKTIVGKVKPFNSKDEDLVAWERSLNRATEEDNLKKCLTRELWQEIVRKVKSWKAHGPDGLQSFWWKAFKSANAALYKLARYHLISGTTLSSWITVGRVVLIHKSGPHEDPANYRPIACLNTCYKILTSYITAILRKHVMERNILPPEQIALRRGVWGCTHALTLDQGMIADALNQTQRPISVAWIDYKKAFDSLPHSYIKWLISAIDVPASLVTFIKGLISHWKVRYEAKDSRGNILRSNYLKIKSGVLQGDSFSPLLFCIAMAPISHAIKKMKCGYRTASGTSTKTQVELSHLFYMDDLKLYGNSQENLTKMIKKVASISTAINMQMNTKKCAVANFIPNHMQEAGVAAQPSQRVVCFGFPSLDKDGLYKYLGIEQSLGVKESDTWDRVEEKCRKSVAKIWGSDLTFRQKVNSFNITIIPALSYIIRNTLKGSGKYVSVLQRGEELDQEIRNILRNTQARYKANCVARLYLSVELGGCGLKSVQDSLEEATIYSWAYLCTKVELKNPLNLFVSMTKRDKRSVISDASHVLNKYGITAELNLDQPSVKLEGIQFVDARLLARQVVEKLRLANNNSRRKIWEDLVLAGRVIHSNSNVDLRTSFLWLKAGKLSSTAVRNVLSAQEGCLITRTHPMHKNSSTNICRACGKTSETIEHVTAGCSKWLPTLYIDRHDSVARNIHYRLCEKYGLDSNHYSQSVDLVKENDQVKLYWNQPVQTKTIIRHNKPDIVIFDKSAKTATIVEVAVSWFTGIERQIDIKTNRYCVNGNYEHDLDVPYPMGDSLLRELRTEGWKAEFVPVVIGVCGEVVSSLSEQLSKRLGISKEKAEDCIERMERSAALGTSRIIKNHLAIKDS